MNETKSNIIYYAVLLTLFLSAVTFASYYDGSQKKQQSNGQKYSRKIAAQAAVNQ